MTRTKSTKNKAVTPSFEEFKKLARRGNLIPVCLEILADTETPVSAFLKVAGKEDSCFLLESVEHGEKIGRYSFIGSAPSEILAAEDDVDMTVLLEERMKQYRFVSSFELPAFAGGFVGFLSYENVRFFEKIRLNRKSSQNIPESIFFLADRIVLFDHLNRTLKIIALCRTSEGLKSSYERGVRAVQEMHKALTASAARVPAPPSLNGMQGSAVKSNVSRAAFEEAVRRAKKYIRQGDCIQIVLSQRFDLGRVNDPFQVYRSLRSINPSPYMFYFKHKGLSLVGSSPELLVKKEGKKAEIRPIAGTRKRGTDEASDQALERDLKKSVKEHAEHLMLVDLGRNDLGRVCRYETVKVKEYARVERYSHVMHLVSEVSGELSSGQDAFSLLRSSFPAGTVTGAPKIRAMEIIDELETTARGPYAGCLGYFSFNGDMDMCITIRTIVIHGGHAFVQAGAGIVYDSAPSKEYLETVNKARALVCAVQAARHPS